MNSQLTTGLVVLLFSTATSATTINFAALADGSYGESIWKPLEFASYGLTINGYHNGNKRFAYLDAKNAGLGVCKKAKHNPNHVNQKNSGSGSNHCKDSSDDNVSKNEHLEFTFEEDTTITGLWLNNNHDGGFDGNDTYILNGAYTSVSTTEYNFLVGAGESFTVAYGGNKGKNRKQFYVDQIEFNKTPRVDIPEPAMLSLLALSLIGIGAKRRRRVNK